MAALFGNGQSTLAAAPNAPAPSTTNAAGGAPAATAPSATAAASAPADTNGLISAAAKDLADYQRLTAEGKLGEAGQKLEALKQKLEALNRRSVK
jgi:hypothetical protein